MKKESNYKNEPSIVVNKNPRKNFSKYIIWIAIVLIIIGVGIWSVKIITNSMASDDVKLPDENQNAPSNENNENQEALPITKVDDIEVYMKEKTLQFLKSSDRSINLFNKYYYSYADKIYYDYNNKVKLDISDYFSSFSLNNNIKNAHIIFTADVKVDNKKLLLIQDKNDFEVIEFDNIRHYIPLTTGKDYANRELKALSISSKDENISGIYNLKGEKISNYLASYGSKNLLGNDFEQLYYYKNDYIMYNGENGVGLLDMNGNVILEAKYKTLVQAKNNTYIALLNEKYGIVDDKGKVIVPFDNDLIIEFNTIYMLVKGNKFALMDENYKFITDYTLDYNPRDKYVHFATGTYLNPIYSNTYGNKNLISFFNDSFHNDGYTYIIDEKKNVQRKDQLFDKSGDYLYSKEQNDKEIIIKVYDENLNVKNTIKYEKKNTQTNHYIYNQTNSRISITDELEGKQVSTYYSLETGEECSASIDNKNLLFTRGNYQVYKENDKYIAYHNDKKILESNHPIDDINDTYVVIRKSVDNNRNHDESKLYKFVDK